MAVQTFYPKSIDPDIDTSKSSWKDLSHIKNITNTYAETTQLIYSDSPPRSPQILKAKQFNIKLPAGALIQKITVEYWHQKVEYNHKIISMNAPTIKLLGLGNLTKPKKGAAPTAKMTGRSVSWTVEPSLSQIQSANFGVQIQYPNATKNQGKMRIKCIRVKVTYKTPSYSLNWTGVKNVYNKTEMSVGLNLTNVSKTDYNPEVIVTLPIGFSLNSFTTKGTFEMVNARTYKWKPTMSRKISSADLSMVFDIDVTYSSGQSSFSAIFVATEQLNGTNASYTITVTDKPGEGISPDDEDIDEDEHTLEGEITWGEHLTIPLYVNETYKVKIDCNPPPTDEGVIIPLDIEVIDLPEQITLELVEGTFNPSTGGYMPGSDGYVIFNLTATAGIMDIETTTIHQVYPIRDTYLDFSIAPDISEFNLPYMTKLIVDDPEELDRLGNGYIYTAESLLKVATSETMTTDWYKNFRVGIFNNPISSNITSSIDYTVTDDICELVVAIPGTIDTSHLRFSVEAEEVIITDNEGNTYDFTTHASLTIPFFDYSTPLTVTKALNPQIGETLDLKVKLYTQVTREEGGSIIITWEDIWEQNYSITFNGTEETVVETISDSTDYDNLTNAEIFENASYWSRQPKVMNEWDDIKLDFTYNEDYPLILLFIQDFEEGHADSYELQYTNPVLIEKEYYNGREPDIVYPAPIGDLISESSSSEASIPSLSPSTPIIIYEPNLPENTGTDEETVVQGVSVTMDLNAPTSAVFYAKLKLGEHTGARSVIVSETAEQVVFGGKTDTWGFGHSELVNLETVEVELYMVNNKDSVEYVNFDNARLVLYTETLEPESVTCKIDGEDLRYYGFFVNDLKIPQGLDTDTDYLTIDGTDTNDGYRQTIDTKEIELELFLPDCDMLNKTQFIQQLSTLIVNDRDMYHRPIPKRIEFSHMPDVYYEYICEDSLENELDFSSATLKVKLQIPAGTGYAKEDTITGSTGANNGLCAVKPIINLTATANQVVITEENTKQKFTVNYTELASKQVKIDCDAQTITTQNSEEDDDAEAKEIDLITYCDINNDWFQLIGEYSFSIDGGVIQSVQFAERW